MGDKAEINRNISISLLKTSEKEINSFFLYIKL